MFRRLSVLCLAAASFAGCGGDDKACPLPAAATVTALIGPAGGTVELTSGGKVEIPAGALAADTMISVTEVADAKPLPLGLDAVGKAYAFKPHGTMFGKEVSITLPFADSDAAAVRPMKLDDDADETWQTVAGATKTTDTLTFKTPSFSIYVAARPRRNSGVIVLPDGAIILPRSDAGLTDDAAVGVDAAGGVDAALPVDAGMDAASLDGGCATSDGGCPVGNMIDLVAGRTHVCALYASGVVYCWGDGSYGQSGQGVVGPNAAPGQVLLYTGAPLVDVAAIGSSASADHTCAVRNDGSVVCWGRNSASQCGAAAPKPSAPRAYVVTGVSSAIKVAAGLDHSCAVLADQHVVCWGSNVGGKLGNGDAAVTESASPLPVVAFNPAGAPIQIADAIEVVVGSSHACALHASRAKVSCWGSDDAGGGWYGLLGRGSNITMPTPIADAVLLPPNTIVQSLRTGHGYYASHTCVLPVGSGAPICWGTNTYRQFAPAMSGFPTPQAMDSYYSDPQAIALGQDFTCVSYINASFGPRVACQGSCGAGNCANGMDGTADGVPSDVASSMDRTSFLDPTTVEFMSAGSQFVCVKLVGGGVTCWGGNPGYVFGTAGNGRNFCDLTASVPGLP